MSALEYYGYTTPSLRDKVLEVGQWLARLPDPTPTEENEGLWSCHVVARAVRIKFFPHWEVKDGYFGSNFRHSWLERETDTRLILDAYPVASVGSPILVDGSTAAPWSKLYALSPTDWYASQVPGFDRSADELLEMMEEKI